MTVSAFIELGRLARSVAVNFAETAITDPEVLADLLDFLNEEAGVLDRVFDVSISDNDVISGKAEEKVTQARSQIYGFQVNGKTGEGVYRLLNTAEMAEFAASDGGWPEVAEFAAKKTGARAGKKLNCKPGNVQCGGKCQSGNKNCRFSPTPDKAATAQAIASKAKGKKATTPKAATTTAPPQSKTPPPQQSTDTKPKTDIPDNLPKGKTNDYAESWKKHWDNAPDDLKALLGAVDQPEKDVYGGGTAYYRGGTIHMGNHTPDGKGRGGAVWRHEYGHYLDDKLTDVIGGRKADEAINQVSNGRYKNREELQKLIAEDPAEGRSLNESVVKKLTGEEEFVFVTDLSRRALGSTQGKGYLSFSDDGRKAFTDDESHLISRAKAADQKAAKLFDDELDKYKGKGKVAALLKEASNPPSEQDKIKIGRVISRFKTIDEVKADAEAAAIAALGKGKKKVNTDTAAFKKELEKQKQRIYEERLEDQAKDGDLASELLLGHIRANPQSREDIDLMAAPVLAHPRDPVALATTASTAFNSLALGEDLIGSITANKVGTGHSDSYYRQNPGTQQTEAFANLVSIYGTGHPLSERVLQKLSLNGYRFMRSSFNQTLQELSRES